MQNSQTANEYDLCGPSTKRLMSSTIGLGEGRKSEEASRQSLLFANAKGKEPSRPHSFHPLDRNYASLQLQSGLLTKKTISSIDHLQKEQLPEKQDKENNSIAMNIHKTISIGDKPPTKLWEVNWTYLIPETHKENGIVPILSKHS